MDLKYGDEKKVKNLLDVVFGVYESYHVLEVYENPFFVDLKVQVKGVSGLAEVFYRVNYLNMKDSFILDLKEVK